MIADKLSRLGQTIQTELSLHPEVFQAICFLVAPASIGPVYHKVQQQATTVCFTSSTTGLGSGCIQSVLGGSGPLCLATRRHLGQSGGEVAGLPMQQDHSDCSRVAQRALVLGPGGHVQLDPIVPAQPAQSF